jgi:phospholipase C
VIVMENKEYGDVLQSGQAPYVHRLANRYALATQSYAITHPSLPNYLTLVGGSTFGITDDCTDCSVTASNLVDQLEAHHISWKAYMEGMPSPCYKGAIAGDYAKRHDPFMYFRDIRERGPRCHRVVPFRQLRTDIERNALPRFVWITPDVCHDGHDCDLSVADGFLQRHVPKLLRNLGTNGVLFLTWDEGSSDAGCCRLASGGHIVTIVAGPGAKRGVKNSARVDHYSVLRTIERGWHLKLLRLAGCSCTRGLDALLR